MVKPSGKKATFPQILFGEGKPFKEGQILFERNQFPLGR